MCAINKLNVGEKAPSVTITRGWGNGVLIADLGNNTEQGTKQAVAWLRKAAEQGHASDSPTCAL